MQHTDNVEYILEKGGHLSEQITTRIYADNTQETLSHILFIYDEEGRVAEEKHLRVKDNSCCEKHILNTYNETGKLGETKLFIDEGFQFLSKYTYNEFGEIIYDSTFYGVSGYWTEYSYRLDEFGTPIMVSNFKSYSTDKGFRYQVEYH